jgi:UDP-GlcNAc:undecaprenyl-phosphate GlcNAc-1-phosphate transferase
VLIMWLWAALIAFGTVIASLYTGPAVLATLGAMTLVTVVLTFLLPMLNKPRLPLVEEG